MIKILYSPQVNELDNIRYTIQGEVIIVKFNQLTDTFDFTNLPDGVVQGIESTLPVNPIINAERENGILYIEVLNFIKENASLYERFPNWIEVE